MLTNILRGSGFPPEEGFGFEGSTIPDGRLDGALASASSERHAIFADLKKREWFKRTSQDVQTQLALLPETEKENWNGFLRDLSQRPEKISNVTVVSLERLAKGNFTITPIFNVVNDKGQPFTYEYVSWRYGPESGFKGLVLLEKDGKPTHFVILKGERFATGRMETDSVGGFSDLCVDGVTSALQNIRSEISQELGLPELRLTAEPVDLGKLCVDAGMTNNSPGLFLASIDASDALRIGELENPDSFELMNGVKILPIAALRQAVLEVQDSYFLACVLRAWALGKLPLDSP